MKKGRLEMSSKERQRMVVLERVKRKELSLKEAAAILLLSYRQMKRVMKRFRKKGALGLVHRARGRPSPRRKKAALRRRALAWVRRRYGDFGPTLAAEKLARCHDIVIDHETLRRWMMAEGFWQKGRRRSKHRSRRERRCAFGELLQIDGSPHDWFEGRGPKCCLMEIVDDATGITMGRFSEQETSEAALRLLKAWIERYGIPRAIYVDRKNTFITEREPTAEELAEGIKPLTALGQICKQLGIEIIPAYSPQAKGRIERKHGLAQDRLIKEMRLESISTIDAANKFAPRWFEQMNRRFAADPSGFPDVHRPLDPKLDPESLFAWEYPRSVGNDWTVRFDNRIFQILEQTPLPPAKSRVTVRQRLDAKIEIVYRGQIKQWKEIFFPARPAFVAEVEPKLAETAPIKIQPKKGHKPPPDHEWRGGSGLGAKKTKQNTKMLGALPPDPRSLPPLRPPDEKSKRERPSDRLDPSQPSVRSPDSALESLFSGALSSSRARKTSVKTRTLSPGKRGHF